MNIYQLLKSLGLSSGQQPEIGYKDLIFGDYATEEAKKRFPDESGVGGNQDAFRHLVWQANLQREMPYFAKLIGDIHESRIPFIGREPIQGKSETEMDLYNNALGRKIADQATSYDDVYRIADEYIKNKKVKTVPIDIVRKEEVNY